MHVVNSLKDARSVLAASRELLVNSKVELVSPPYAACHAGVGYYRALIDQLRTEFPDIDFRFRLCCGSDAAIAYEARMLGLEIIMSSSSDTVLV